ncbi:unnamed protein product [Cuscuta epithymum]|uniref:F-box domain-containing protein n=1 Tax=Cuscuta epithymum TaxID=186058 RepID=A0AAV0FX38_9ASTE|nr:unnamed protein product [Cuscuta epithymum]
MAADGPCFDLPEECWDLIFRHLNRGWDLESLSLVCKRFYALSNALLIRLSVTGPISSDTFSKLLCRFPNLVSLNLSKCKGDLRPLFSEIERFASLINLKELDISRHQIEFDLSNYSGLVFKNLKVLKCRRVPVMGDSHLFAIACSFPCLEELDISDPNMVFRSERQTASQHIVTDKGIEALSSSLLNLRKISISGNHFITDSSIASLVDRLNLESIEILDCPLITANAILSMMRKSISLCSVSASCIVFPRTHSLVYQSYCRTLHVIDLGSSIVPDAFLCSLAHLPLVRLSLVNCTTFTLQGLSFLVRASPLLQYFALGDSDLLTDKDMEILSVYLHSLVTIKLNSCSGLTISTISALVRNCHLLEEIHMENAGLGRNDITLHCSKSSSLKTLKLGWNDDITNECLLKIACICPKLEELDVSACAGISEEGIANVLHICPDIKSLGIDFCSGIQSIGYGCDLPKLEVLSAAYSAVSNKGLQMVGIRCSGLQKLVLQGCLEVTSSGVEDLGKTCRRLREIDLGRCDYVDVRAVERIILSCQTLRRVTSPSDLSEKLKRIFLQHGCLIRDLLL